MRTGGPGSTGTPGSHRPTIFRGREQADDGTAAVVQQYEDETAIRLLLKASNGAGDDADTALTWATYWVD